MTLKPKYLIGVDEAGRGPLAGPVSVGCVKIAADFDWELIQGVNDSKQLTPENREAIFRRARELQRDGLLDYSVSLTAASVIDSVGIVPAIRRSMNRSLTKITSSVNTNVNISINFYDDYLVLLDGGLKAPQQFVNQQTIIRGDGSEKVIGLASILAKVTRDRYMVHQACKPLFAPYHFHTHKGYGTPAHRALISKYGLSPLHRKTFCKNVILL